MKIIRDQLVADKIGAKSRATPWRLVKSDPDFPRPLKVSPGITGWVEAEVDDYLQKKVNDSRGARPRASKS
jgi:prophage regulatory protein